MSDARGDWDGKTLVVDVTNNSDEITFDSHATFHSDKMRLTERWTMVDKNTIYYEVTVDDPTVFTRTWKLAITLDRSKDPNAELWEEACYEGNERAVTDQLRIGRMLKAEGKTGIHQHPKDVIEYYKKKAAEEAAQKKDNTELPKP